jgi:hypothetical protein
MTTLLQWTFWSSYRAFFVTTVILSALLVMRLIPRLGERPVAPAPLPPQKSWSGHASATKTVGGGPPKWDNCQMEVERLSGEMERLELIQARSRQPFQVFASSSLNRPLNDTVRGQLDRFFAARPGRYGHANIECRGDSCLIAGPTSLLPELRSDEWFRARISGVNSGGDKIFLRLADRVARDAGDVLHGIVERVKGRIPRQCPSGRSGATDYRIRLRESIVTGRYQLSVDTAGADAVHEQCVVGLFDDEFGQLELSDMGGRGAVLVERL